MSAKDTKAKEFYPTTRDLQNFSTILYWRQDGSSARTGSHSGGRMMENSGR